MQNLVSPVKEKKRIESKEPNFDAKNKKRLEMKRKSNAKRAKAIQLKEQIVAALVLVGLLTLVVASLLKGGLFLKEIVVSSAIIGGVLFIRSFGKSTVHKA